MRKFFITLFVLLACLLAGCMQKTAAEDTAVEPLTFETLRLELPRGSDIELMQTVFATLPEKLKAALKDNGVSVARIELSAGSSYALTAQALNEGGVDLAVFTGLSFAELGKDAVPLLTEQEAGTLPDTGDPTAWTDAKPEWSREPAAGKRMLILAGPSDYGRQLAARAGSDNSLTWEELNHARWAVCSTPETRMASVWLADNYSGNSLTDLSNLDRHAINDGEDSLFVSLANGSADIAVIPADARIDHLSNWKEQEHRPADIFTETRVIGVTEKYYKTILAVSPNNESLHSEQFQNALANAMLTVCTAQKEVSAAFGGILTQPVGSSDLDGMRRMLSLSE